jgi:hypothetical protein
MIYKLVSSTGIEHLESQVNDLGKQGFKCLGRPFTFQDAIVQAMTKVSLNEKVVVTRKAKPRV